MGFPPSPPPPDDRPSIGPPTYHPSPIPPQAQPPGYAPLPPTAPPASAGLFVVLAGVLATGLGMAALDWVSWDAELDGASEGATLNGVAGLFAFGDAARSLLGSFEHTYLQYLSWLTVTVTALTALLATLPQAGPGPRSAVRGMATVVGVFGVIGTVLLATALQDVSDDEDGGGFELSVGPWVTVAGLGLMALGALLGPPKPR